MGLTRENKAEIKEIVKQTVSEVLELYLDGIMDKIISKVKSSFQEDFNQIKKTLQETQEKLDKLQQENKKSNLIVFGLNETTQENIREKLIDTCEDANVSSVVNSIRMCHRLGKTNNKNPRPILLKFKNEDCRSEFLLMRKYYARSKIYFKEDLTKRRLDLLKYASVKFGFRNVWSTGGIVKIKIGGEIFSVKSKDDCDGLNPGNE